MVHSRLYGKSPAPDLTNGEYTATLRNESTLAQRIAPARFMIVGSLRQIATKGTRDLSVREDQRGRARASAAARAARGKGGEEA